MEQINNININFLDESIEILQETLEKLEKLRARAEETYDIDRRNQLLIKKMSKEVTAIKQGVIG